MHKVSSSSDSMRVLVELGDVLVGTLKNVSGEIHSVWHLLLRVDGIDVSAYQADTGRSSLQVYVLFHVLLYVIAYLCDSLCLFILVFVSLHYHWSLTIGFHHRRNGAVQHISGGSFQAAGQCVLHPVLVPRFYWVVVWCSRRDAFRRKHTPSVPQSCPDVRSRTQ